MGGRDLRFREKVDICEHWYTASNTSLKKRCFFNRLSRT
ncbi:GntR family transcriptional regulator, partial [Escherichia coli]|nr:GntR family transcriptional regulator [Escherichia coli]